jgi:hypothetical protein
MRTRTSVEILRAEVAHLTDLLHASQTRERKLRAITEQMRDEWDQRDVGNAYQDTETLDEWDRRAGKVT